MLLCLLFGLSFQSVAQEPNFINFSRSSELKSSEVYDLYQDCNGLMWFATDRGLINYNGYVFNNIGLTEKLANQTVFKFYPQTNGDIWCSTSKGKLFRFNPNNYTFKTYKFNHLLVERSKGGTINSLFIDDEFTVFIGYSDVLNFIKIDKNGAVSGKISVNPGLPELDIHMKTVSPVNSFSYLSAEKSEIENEIQLKINASRKFHKTAAFKNNSLILNDQTVSFYKGKYLHKEIAFDKRLIGVGFIDANHFWVGKLTGGVDVFNLKGDLVLNWLNSESVTSMIHDHDNGIWVSTLTSGVYYCQNEGVISYSLDDDARVNDISQDGKGGLLIGMNTGDFYSIKGNDAKLIFQASTQQPGNCQYYSKYKNVLFASNNTVFENGSLNSRLSNYYFSSISDSKDDWPILINSKWFMLLYENRISEKFFVDQSLIDVQVKKGGFYLGTRRGLFIYNSENQTSRKANFYQYDIEISDLDKIGSSGLVIGTKGKGVGIYRNNQIVKIRKQEGLTNNHVTAVYVENENSIWAATTAGLNLIEFFNGTEYTIRQFSESDGLPENDLVDVVVIGKVVWIATRFEVSSVLKKAIQYKKTNKKFFLNENVLKVNREEVNDLESLDYTKNNIEFHYSLVSFSNGEKPQFRYKLLGQNDNWNYTNNLNVVYEAIPPGNYEFVLEVGHPGHWSSERITKKFQITPPFYKSWWFIISVIVFCFVMIYLFFKYRILEYNRDILREMLRHMLKRVKKNNVNFIIKENGKQVKIDSTKVLYVKSDNNYIEIHTTEKIHIAREKISNFLSLVPDPIEYIRLHRSYIVRIDKISAKTGQSVLINEKEIKVGDTYHKEFSLIQF